MKGKCDKCNEVYNITDSPNKIEGYFVTQQVWEVRQSDSLDEVMKEKGNKPIYCQKCPKCGHIMKMA
jgi:DNA-directed RNA polymerase subunit M/transcription elongation factor TFIIS